MGRRRGGPARSRPGGGSFEQPDGDAGSDDAGFAAADVGAGVDAGEGAGFARVRHGSQFDCRSSISGVKSVCGSKTSER